MAGVESDDYLDTWTLRFTTESSLWPCVKLSKSEVPLMKIPVRSTFGSFSIQFLFFMKECRLKYVCSCVRWIVYACFRVWSPKLRVNLMFRGCTWFWSSSDQTNYWTHQLWVDFHRQQKQMADHKQVRKAAAVRKMFHKRCVSIWKDDSLSLYIPMREVDCSCLFFMLKHFNTHRRPSLRGRRVAAHLVMRFHFINF